MSGESGKDEGGRQVKIPGYELQAKLGEGATGAVYRAHQISMDRTVAIKILFPRMKKDEAYIKRFIREARSVAKLNHEHIIKGIDVGEADGEYYFVMEYVDGPTLQDLISRKGKLDPDRVIEIGRQMADALAHARKHDIIHRDVKPENLMINAEGIAKLCDLGLAKQQTDQDSSITQDTGTSMGTPHYMSPEQAKGKADIDFRTDIYALGATLYHAATGEVPFKGDTTLSVMTNTVTEELTPPREVRREVGRGFNIVIKKMMAKDPADRYQDHEKMLEDFEQLTNNAFPKNATDRPKRKQKSHAGSVDTGKKGGGADSRNWGLLVGAGGVVLVAVLALLIMGNDPDSKTGTDEAKTEPDVSKRSGGNQRASDTGTSGPDTADKQGGSSEEGTPARNKRVENARREKKEITSMIADYEGGDERLEEIRKRIQTFQQDYEETEVADGGEALESKLQARIKQLAEKYLKEIRPEAKDLKEKGRLFEALQVFRDMPEVYEGTPASERAKKQVKQIKEQINFKFQADRSKIEKLIDDGQLEKARKKLKETKTYAGAVKEREREKLGRKIDRKLERRKEIRKTSKKAYRTLKRKLEDKLDLDRQSIVEIQDDEFANLFETFSRKIEHPTYQKKLNLLRSDVEALQSFGNAFEEGARRAGREGSYRVSFEKLKGTVAGFQNSKVQIKQSGGRVIGISPGRLSLDDRVNIAFWNKENLPSRTLLGAGIAAFYGRALITARSRLKEAKNAGEDRAKVYLNRVDKIFKRFYESFAGNLTKIEDRTYKLTYDFSAKDQLKEWKVKNKENKDTDLKLSYEGGRNAALIKGTGLVLNSVVFDRNLEYTLICSSPSGDKFGLVVLANARRGYSGYIDKKLEVGNTGKFVWKSYLLRMSRKWKQRARLRELKTNNIIKKRQRVKLQMKATPQKVSVILNGKEFLSSGDRTYQQGQVGVTTTNNTIRIHRVSVKGTVSSSWFSTKIQKLVGEKEGNDNGAGED